MPEKQNINRWTDVIRTRYENYLRTSFYFKDPELRISFQSALQAGDNLLKGPCPEPARGFKKVMTARELAEECFPDKSKDLLPALREDALYAHQERAVRGAYAEQRNVVVATGTASGKTESFLYPILFELYHQHLSGELRREPGVRAMILYPMNALANDQRERLGEICKTLREEGSDFAPTFGQYIGRTPENRADHRRNAQMREEERLPYELVFREEMRTKPPHILLTNYSMLEYLLIRPNDSPLFDNGCGKHWQFIVLDEAHQYRGAKGMEMGMLIRRLKQRLRDGGRQNPFRCIATSATISSGEGEKDKQAVAEFAKALLGEPFSTSGIIFGKHENKTPQERGVRRFHIFARALEGAFLIHKNGKDCVVLNRKKAQETDGPSAESLEIALCRECGQHYYVGRERGGKLEEAVRDPSQSDFGVEYYLPLKADADGCTHRLCRCCGKLSRARTDCACNAAIPVKKCESHRDRPDQLKKCETCGYRRGGIGDPVQEIVHGSDGPNAVMATALHELLPEDGRKVLAFTDSRQEAAFFAWFAEDSYQGLRDRNLLLRALKGDKIGTEGLSIEDIENRLVKQWDNAGMFDETDTAESKNRKVLKAIFREALTDERRISLAGVGLAKWFVEIPQKMKLPEVMQAAPWNLNGGEPRRLLGYLLDELRLQQALSLPEGSRVPVWNDISPWPQQAYGRGRPGRRKNIAEWGGRQSAVVKHFLNRLLEDSGMSDEEKRRGAAAQLMQETWDAIRKYDREVSETNCILVPAGKDGVFRLNSRWLRIKPANSSEILECDTCARLSAHNIRCICPRNGCPGKLKPVERQCLSENHYRVLYESKELPPVMRTEEHTAQIASDAARKRQDEFKNGRIHLLSSSTTFEVGVDLGDLEVVFLRNVPPEPFNYTQRIGRAGRREKPGLALTYCRRNPHDLYHYEDPESRIIAGKVKPPRLRMTNKKIISRHMTAVALSAFFREGNENCFENMERFIGDWASPQAVSDLRQFCKNNRKLKDSLHRIVPEEMHGKINLDSDKWIEDIAGAESRLGWAEAEICADYRRMEELEKKHAESRSYHLADRIKKSRKTIAEESTLVFLSRKAIIPKYGFPVDVVELDIHRDGQSAGVSLQRDLSQAIAEYAPGGKVVANKKEWNSYGVKTVPGKALPVKCYDYDDARNFRQRSEHEDPQRGKKYLSPWFGFTTQLFEKSREPTGKAQRLYTTRPFFGGFDNSAQPDSKERFGVKVTQALPGSLVVLCEGRDKKGFYICRKCGRHMTNPASSHETPAKSKCSAQLERFSLGHELFTDIVRLQFPRLTGEWDAYSLAYAILLGAAETLDVPADDLNTTITGGEAAGETAIVLYDNVPGGAGLVEQLQHEKFFRSVLENARNRMRGNCGCDLSCYGCLRSYRNQFAHPYLDRNRALEFLNAALK